MSDKRRKIFLKQATALPFTQSPRRDPSPQKPEPDDMPEELKGQGLQILELDASKFSVTDLQRMAKAEERRALKAFKRISNEAETTSKAGLVSEDTAGETVEGEAWPAIRPKGRTA